MGKKDPRVDAYIADAAEFARPVLNHLRDVVHAACPMVEETFKWSRPHFVYRGMFCGMSAFKEHCSFGFWHRSMRQMIEQDKSGQGMGQFGKITRLTDLPPDRILVRYLKQAMKLNEQGVKAPSRPRAAKPAVRIPANMKAALAGRPKSQAGFAALRPSHQREYIEWIVAAKREETVANRMATMLQWLAEGKPRHWKYER